jgi:hypothetical protein
MTKQTKIATKILERAYARELIKAAVGMNDFGAGSYTPPGQPKPMNSGITPAGRTLAAAPSAVGNAVDGAGSGIYGGFNAALGAPLSGIARAGQGIEHTNHVLNNDAQAQNASAGWGAAAKSLWSNTVAGGKDLLEAPSRMLGALDGPTHMQTLQEQQGAQLSPGQRDVFNRANNAAQNASTGLVAAPAFSAVAKAAPLVDKAMQLSAAGDVAYRSIGGGTPEVNQLIANTLGLGNQAQAAEPQQAQPAPAGVNYNQMAADLNSGNPEMQDAANEFATAQSGVNYNQMTDALNNGQPEMQDAATAFAAENNTDQTEVAQDAAATPAQSVVPPVVQQPAAPAEQPAAPVAQQPEPAQPPAQPVEQQPAPAEAAKPDYTQQWAAADTPAKQKKVIQDLAASLPPVSEDHAAGAKDVAAGNLNTDAARKFIDEKLGPVGDEYIKSITAQNPSDLTLYGKAQGMWNSAVNAIGHEGMAALGLGVPLALLGMMGGSGIATLLGVLGIGAAGLFGAANGAFGEDGQRAMGQGMASVGRMMGMDVPTDPVPVDRLVGENAPATIHADIMKSAPTGKEKMQLFTNKTMRDAKAQSIRAELKQLDRAKQIAGMPEQAAVPVLMALGQAQGKPLTTEVAKQVYRNAVQTTQMANDKDSDMGKQLAEAQQFSTDADKYVAQQAGNYIAPYVAPAKPYVTKAIPYVNQATQYADQASQFLAPFFSKVTNAK